VTSLTDQDFVVSPLDLSDKAEIERSCKTIAEEHNWNEVCEQKMCHQRRWTVYCMWTLQSSYNTHSAHQFDVVLNWYRLSTVRSPARSVRVRSMTIIADRWRQQSRDQYDMLSLWRHYERPGGISRLSAVCTYLSLHWWAL